ncbi:MAG: SAM-dependent methyltransferase [Planctomycetota bacterium]|jgi:SAM-dependent methyltransferase
MTPEDTEQTIAKDPRLEKWRAVLEASGVQMNAQGATADLNVVLQPLAGIQPTKEELQQAKDRALSTLAEEGCLILAAPGQTTDIGLANWRNQLWPEFHSTSIIRITPEEASHRTLSGKNKFKDLGGESVTLLLSHRRGWVQSPAATVEKFDKNAIGWNGEPGKPGYAHFRWMRRYLGFFGPRPKSGDRVLDFGCGAGWCGIESVNGISNVTLCSFDPSPEMMRITADNAKASGVTDYTGRTGFGNEPPFPAEGEEQFDLIISSGVVSFAPSVEEFLEGLISTCKPGSTLVFGDINVNSRGFRDRRRSRPLLPVREMNAQTAEEMRTWLEKKGFMHEETTGYQLTWPIPEAMYFSERKLKGVLAFPLLLANRMLAGINRMLGNVFANQFDSWAMRLIAPRFMGVSVGSPNSIYIYNDDGTKRLRSES